MLFRAFQVKLIPITTNPNVIRYLPFIMEENNKSFNGMSIINTLIHTSQSENWCKFATSIKILEGEKENILSDRESHRWTSIRRKLIGNRVRVYL